MFAVLDRRVGKEASESCKKRWKSNSVVFETSGDFLGFIKEVDESFEKIRQLEKDDKYYNKE